MQAYVSCTCYRHKKAKAHPHPQYVRENAPGYVTLDQHATEKALSDHEEWLYDACPHAFMQVAWEDFESSEQLEVLTAALAGTGANAALLSSWTVADSPPAPWGTKEVEQALRELEWIKTSLPPFDVMQVQDEATGEILVESIREKVYCISGDGTQLEFGPLGICMARRGTPVFRTQRLTQEELPDGTYRLTPEDGAPRGTTAAFVPYDSENPDHRRPTPRSVIFCKAQKGATELGPILRPLENLLKAARGTENVIVWTL